MENRKSTLVSTFCSLRASSRRERGGGGWCRRELATKLKFEFLILKKSLQNADWRRFNLVMTSSIFARVAKKTTHLAQLIRGYFTALSLVLICRRPTCDIVAGTAWEHLRRRQQDLSQVFVAGMPAKLTSSQLRRHAGGKDWDDLCC